MNTNRDCHGINIVEELEQPKRSKQPERQKWNSGLEFLMSCITVSIGLGNIWRFPFTAYENGGGAFLIPYIVVLFLIGKPMYYLEVLLGQFTSKSSLKIWSVCPLLVGVGVGQAYAGFAVLTYYSSLLALTLYYLFESFRSILPWSYCREEWGNNCVGPMTNKTITISNATKLHSSSELYFLKIVIKELDDISNGIGLPSWQLTIALLASWLITCIVIMGGIKSTGKTAYFLAIFPYVILVTLLIRAVTLEGSFNGIIYFLKPNWVELFNVKVWKAAVVQCFFSLAIGLGPLITFSSYNKFDHNIHRDVVIVTTLDTVTSIISGVTIFGILGNLAHSLKETDINKVVRSGTGLAFISYPDAMAKFDAIPQVFSSLFFLMLFVLGIGTLVAQANTLVTIICDHFKRVSVWKVSMGTSIFGFFSGIVFITPAGQWILNLVDFYACTSVIFGLAFFQIAGISWIYGLNKFCDDIQFMTHRPVSLYWRTCWAVITPGLLLFIFISSMVEIRTLTYAGKNYPMEADIAGWVLLGIGFAQCPLWAVWCVVQNYNGGTIRSIRMLCMPNLDWGPCDMHLKKEWIAFKKRQNNERNKKGGRMQWL